ncbi:MAG TPA: hypothetical protein VF096_06790 [Azonexus sp.]
MTAKPKIERRKGTPRSWVARGLRLPLIIASIACSFAHADVQKPASQSRHVSSKKMGLSIDVRPGGWGNASKESIETALYAVADTLMSQLPRKLAVPIVVRHSDGAPVALYDRGPAGEYLVHLHASGENWHLYVYEFAHELCHILSNYEENVGADTTKYNQWFEETLCETASLYTLQKLAATWETAPPSPRWSNEARKLRRFFDHLIAEGHRQLPAHTPLHDWLVEKEEHLRKDPYLRKENEVMAKLLLPLFQDNPQNWEALNYLNLDPDDARNTLRDYLGNWYDNAPAEHKQFVRNVLALFLLDDVMPKSLAAARNATVVADLSGQSPP